MNPLLKDRRALLVYLGVCLVLGAALAALMVLRGEASWTGALLFLLPLMVVFGFTNFLHGFGSFRMPSLTPLAWWYLSVPISGAFICLFIIEQLVNGWRNGFEGEPRSETEKEFTI